MLETDEILPKSKSQVKREMLALHDLGRDLVGLSSKALQQIPLSDEMRDAVMEAKHLKMEPLRRHLKHVGKLMRDEDAEGIRSALDVLRKPHAEEVSVFHEVEIWRDKLLAGNNELINELCERFSGLDRQRLGQLVRNAKKEEALGKPPKSARVLFRYLKEIVNDNAEDNRLA
ncbi:MAG: ribosome-associated protein [Planctomycetota bacterium]|jgi:ribosome-associated protein